MAGVINSADGNYLKKFIAFIYQIRRSRWIVKPNRILKDVIAAMNPVSAKEIVAIV